MCQKWFVKFLGTVDVLAKLLFDMHWEMCGGIPGSYQQKPIAGDSGHTQNIQINKVIDGGKKCPLFCLEKDIVGVWPIASVGAV